ncbi:hypothetical protein BJX62DRAFT_221392 [Aspergillus germanicus]
MQCLSLISVSLFLLLSQHAKLCDGAWVRKFPCNARRLEFQPERPFWVDSLHGQLITSGDSPSLSISMLGVHNTSQLKCSDIDLAGLESDLQLHVLSHPVGELYSFDTKCPLAITDDLTPPEGLLFSQVDFAFSLTRVHRVQTLAADLLIKSVDGTELDCAGVRVTPDIGATASGIIKYVPAVILAVLGIASWNRHFNRARTEASLEHAAVSDVWRSIWKIVLDITDYLRYLQFVFLAGALTIDYPGFYQPVVGQLSWASLLYWAGLVDHGFIYPGVEDGIYVSNASYGLDYMARMVAHPQVPDIMINAHINLLLLVCGAMFIIVTFLLAVGPSTQYPLSITVCETGYLVLGAALVFFSFPLMAFMSNELRLIGYLPNYRVVIMALVTTVFFGLNFVAHNHFGSDQQSIGTVSLDHSSRTRRQTGLKTWLLRFQHFLPPAVGLLQGLVIGWLQDWGLVQLALLIAFETALLVYLVVQRRWNSFMSRAVWCTLIRVLTLTLSIAFAFPTPEVTKQWLGYFTLCLHASVVVFGYLLLSSLELYRAVRLKLQSIRASSDHGSAMSLRSLHIPAHSTHYTESPTSRPASAGIASYRGWNENRPATAASTNPPLDTKHYVTDFSAFYRSPRSRNQTPVSIARVRPPTSEPRSSDAAGSGSGSALGLSSPSTNQASSRSGDSLDELLKAPTRPDVDYSVRESDSFYGRPRAKLGDEGSPTPGKKSWESSDAPRSTIIERARRRLNEPRCKEKGFQVVRSPRPT